MACPCNWCEVICINFWKELLSVTHTEYCTGI
ncbi:UNVERIFIED_CONTAM: hypothetical protein GTU68_004402 [Idotea baltica]|nr:hypothetical protein [Idotea baltica]